MKPTSRKLALTTGLSYHVLEWAPTAPECDHTVVLVHGFLDLGWGWRPVVDSGLAGRFHIVAPDMRGHGDSDHIGPGGYYHFMDYLADLDSLLTQVGRQRVSLVGHSMGGSIVSFYTGVFPEKIHRLAVLEGMGPPEFQVDIAGRMANWINAWKRARSAAQRTYADRAEAAKRLCQHDHRLSKELALELAEHGTAVTPDGRVRFKHDPLHLTQGPYPFQLARAKELWQRITCPVLLVEARESQFLTMIPDREQRYACVPHSQRLIIENAGHMMQRHQPADLATALAGFLAS